MSKLIATRGEIYAHVHENSRTGLARNLFWNIRVGLEPLILAREEWEPSFACEWVVWPVRTVNDLDGMSLAAVLRPDLIESTLYVGGVHHWVRVETLTITRSKGAGYRIDTRLNVELDVDGTKLRETANLSCGLEFDGVVVVPDSLDPKPATPEAVSTIVAPFISLNDLKAPEFETFRYVLKRKSS
jgi:hypothetical protein